MKTLLTTLLILTSLSLAQAQSEPVMIDQIIALVEDDVITRNELIEEVKKIQQEFRSQGRDLKSSATLNRQVLEIARQTL